MGTEMRQKSGRPGQTMGTRGPGDGKRGSLLTRLPERVKVGFLTRLAAGTGQLPKGMSADTKSVQLVLVRLVKPVKRLKLYIEDSNRNHKQRAYLCGIIINLNDAAESFRLRGFPYNPSRNLRSRRRNSNSINQSICEILQFFF